MMRADTLSCLNYIKIDGKIKYRLTLFDSLLNIPVYEGIARDRAYISPILIKYKTARGMLSYLARKME